MWLISAYRYNYILMSLSHPCKLIETKFRVHVKESDNLSVSGPADLVVTDEGIVLHSIQTGIVYSLHYYVVNFLKLFHSISLMLHSTLIFTLQK